MKALKNPAKISGLTFWLDASDSTTINNGVSASNNVNVYSFRDKINNVELVNLQGSLGPTYSFSAINGNNAISMPYYTGADLGQKALFANNLSQFQGLTFSMFCVYKPTTTIQDNTNGNQKYVVALYSKSRMDAQVGAGLTGPGGFANRAIYLGDERDAFASPQQRLNPSGRYVEADTTSVIPWQTYLTYGEHVPSRSGFGPTSLNKTCMTAVRIQNNLKKMAFTFKGNEFIEDFGASKVYSIGTADSLNLLNRGIKNTGRVDDLGNLATIIIGSPWIPGKNKAEKLYPIEGFFCEFLYFNRYLNDAEYTSVSKYLKKKWID